jgi:HK97 family phage major capsid protein
MKTLEELNAELSVLNVRADEATVALKAEESKEAKISKAAELNAVIDELNGVKAEIEDVKSIDAALNRSASLEKPVARKTVGKIEVSSIKTHDNVYDDAKLGFNSYGDVAQAVHKAAIGANFDPRLNVIKSGNPELQAAGLRQGNGPDGGYLVPAGVRSAELSNEQGMSLDLFAKARNFGLSGEGSVIIPAINETSRADGSQYGGVTQEWLEEEAQMTASEPQFRSIELKPKESGVFIKASNKLLRNSPVALGQFLDMASRDVLRFARSNAIMNGNGAGKPMGFLNSDALVVIDKETSQTADTVVVENVLKMMDSFTEKWLSGAEWLINKRVKAQLALMVVGDKPVYLDSAVTGAPFSTLMGLPVTVTEYNPILGDQGDICLVNMSAYVTATQGGGVIGAESTHFYFDTNKTAFKFIEEVDGQTWLKSSITDFQGSGVSSPFVTLAVRT